MGSGAESISFTEEVLRDCRTLGRVRVVLRNGFGVVEAFVDLADLSLRDGWAHLIDKGFHVHVDIASIAGVRFVEPEAAETCRGAAALWFESGAGTPLLVVLLDQECGAERIDQRRAFDRLRASYGARRALVSLAEIPAATAMS